MKMEVMDTARKENECGREFNGGNADWQCLEAFRKGEKYGREQERKEIKKEVETIIKRLEKR